MFFVLPYTNVHTVVITNKILSRLFPKEKNKAALRIKLIKDVSFVSLLSVWHLDMTNKPNITFTCLAYLKNQRNTNKLHDHLEMGCIVSEKPLFVYCLA